MRLLLLLEDQVLLEVLGALEVPRQRREERCGGQGRGEGVQVARFAGGAALGRGDDDGGRAVVFEVVSFAGEELACGSGLREFGFFLKGAMARMGGYCRGRQVEVVPRG